MSLVPVNHYPPPPASILVPQELEIITRALTPSVSPDATRAERVLLPTAMAAHNQTNREAKYRILAWIVHHGGCLRNHSLADLNAAAGMHSGSSIPTNILRVLLARGYINRSRPARSNRILWITETGRTHLLGLIREKLPSS